MCAVSVIMEYGRDIPIWTEPKWTEFKKLVEYAKKFDNDTQQPDCEKPNLVSWMQDMDQRMAKLESK